MAELNEDFFEISGNHSAIKGAIKLISSLEPSSEFETQRNHHTLSILNSMLSHPASWDQSCAINIQWIGSHFISTLMNLSTSPDQNQLDSVYAMCFRFVCELHLSTKTNLNIDLEEARIFNIRNLEKFTPNAQAQIEFAWRDMPVSIMKALVNSDQIQSLKDFSQTVDYANLQKSVWEKELKEHEETVNRLKDNLEQYESGFNFVGLHQGFEEMSTLKNLEKDNLKFWLKFFGILITLPFAIEAIVIWTHLQEIEKLRTAMIISIVPTLSLAGILIFYFRVLLHNYNSTKAQLLQIELRKTLCRFIQSYVVYAEKMNEKNQGSLGKFEGIIFSGLVSSDDKIPSTFDGLEQIGNILKSMKK